ncbi:hypothetical protein [Aquamicrobium defluvii]|uniref:Uncharacterized protein n=1 Tax=Aquamicrobium defluvii TaxID=69279 RepID=A0A4R6YGT7_9HYPH|nr:hypothetical protein [Aquamicrobium defluvii]TDR35708.1 hypothetical protein DES43_108133 [Aquamicrobium defluvii]
MPESWKPLPMHKMRLQMRPMTLPLQLQQDRRRQPDPVMRPPAMKSRPMPRTPDRCRARLMLGRMRQMLKGLNPTKASVLKSRQ